jgi:hypothetical protein
MTNSLVTPDDLAPFPGAPFSDEVTDAAAAAVRVACDWHIAPSLTETVIVESYGSRFLILPTLYLTAITSIYDVTDDAAPVIITGYRTAATAQFKAGMVDLGSRWPRGMMEATITHGYDECPPDLLPAIAEVARSARTTGELSQVSADGVSRTISGRVSHENSTAIARYTIFQV